MTRTTKTLSCYQWPKPPLWEQRPAPQSLITHDWDGKVESVDWLDEMRQLGWSFEIDGNCLMCMIHGQRFPIGIITETEAD